MGFNLGVAGWVGIACSADWVDDAFGGGLEDALGCAVFDCHVVVTYNDCVGEGFPGLHHYVGTLVGVGC